MTSTTMILLGMTFASTTWTAMAAPGPYAIGIEQVVVAVRKTGMDVSPRQITMLTAAVATTPAPALTVRSVERWSEQRMLVRMECEVRQECLPFFVALGKSPEMFSEAAVPPVPISRAAGDAGHRSPVVQSGSPATLLLEDDRVHIRIPVICLESGAAGQTIRVRGKENRLIYSAQVLAGTLLKGRL